MNLRGNNFDVNCSSTVPRVLTYFNCLHELCIISSGAAPVVESADKKGPNYSD